MYQIDKSAPIALNRCESYDVDIIKKIFLTQIKALGIEKSDFEGKRVVIKPNLVMKVNCEAAVTTHPATLEALILILKEYNADITIAESPGGPYTEAALKNIYKVCGIKEIADKTEVKLNFDTSFKEISSPNGYTSKIFNIITPIVDSDIVINLCKLKSHGLTKMTSAVKNFFGVIPGVQKFEMHARFSNHIDFASMLDDLCMTVCTNKKVLNIVDAIVCMEGNGPSSGTPRKIGCLLMGVNPFVLDLSCATIISFDGTVPMLELAKKRGYCPTSYSDIIVKCDKISDFKISDFKEPDTKSGGFFKIMPNLFGGKLNSFFEPRPVINDKICVGCGECVRSCPVHTISLVEKNGRKKALILPNICIKCYCCQELCPYKAVRIKKNFLFSLIK